MPKTLLFLQEYKLQFDRYNLEVVVPFLIQEVKPLLNDLIDRVGFWIDARLYAEVLQSVGESA
ncbi:MAG: DUF3368 domain-containing protein [Cyanosarcina radialis HA8281-LM2]|nr:DUF3368 domain-containing protein [Cyanosarcina radialis HA8281-LM2]